MVSNSNLKLFKMLMDVVSFYACQLDERTKELDCLDRISNLIVSGQSMSTMLANVVDIIPRYWQYPKLTCARIVHFNYKYTSAGFKETDYKQVSNIIVDGEKIGKVEVFYLEEKAEDDIEPFLQEEQKLLDTVARYLASFTKLKTNEQELEYSRENLYITLRSIGDGVISTDTEEKITFMNPRAEELTGWKTSAAQGKSLEKVFYILNSKTGEAVSNPVKTVLKTGKQRNLANDTLLVSRDGDKYQIADSASPIKDRAGKIRGVVLVFSDITEKYEYQERLGRSEEKYRALVNQSAEMLFLHDLEGNILEVNEAAIKTTGYSRSELLSMSVFDLHPDIEETTPSGETLLQWKDMPPGGEPLNFETNHEHKDGTICPVEVTTNKVTFVNKTYMMALVRDITERKQYEEELRYMSLYDKLTGVYNRAYLEEELRRLEKSDILLVSMIMVDINGLKLINENFSYELGDKYLIDTATILKKVCGLESIVSRWGEDEFVVLLPGGDENLVETIAAKIKQNCKQVHEEKQLPLRVSVGLATGEIGEIKPRQILKRAEDNLHKNKLIESSSIKSDIISALSGILKEKSDETEEHSRRMERLGLKFGKVLNLSETELNKLSLLAAMHDIGKATISEHILKKPGKLSEEEWEIIKEHPERGRRIASYSNDLYYISEEIATHHERWDGKGYPYGLKGDEIPFLSRVIALIDTYDVITNGRSYKDAKSTKEALEEIKRCSSTQFDPWLADEFVKLLEKEYGIRI